MVLTPLRGWANDVMATRMASQWPTVAQATVTEPRSHCDEMAAADAQATHVSPALESLQCDNCSFCQMCFTAALPVTLVLAPQASARYTPPALQEEQFRSAALSLGHKPPIS